MATYEAMQAEINSLEQQRREICDRLNMLKDIMHPIAIWIDSIESHLKHDTIRDFNFDRVKLLISTLYKGKRLQLQHPRWGNYSVYTIDEGRIMRIQEENIKQPYIDVWHMLGIMLKGEGNWYIFPDEQD